MVIFVASLLKKQGRQPAILSRGYGGQAERNDRQPVHLVSDGTRVLMTAADAGDEPVLMAETLPGIPVLTGRRRFTAGQWACDHLGADCLVLDDGYQHRQLARDVDILLIAGDRPFGNGLLLPAGPLRESARGLHRAHAIVQTGQVAPPRRNGATEGPEKAAPAVAGLVPGSIPVFSGQRAPTGIRKGLRGAWEPLATLAGQDVCAFAGIASPGALKKTLEAAGARVVCFLPFPDHHPYREADILHLENTFRPFGVPLVTTEKDAVKLRGSSAFADGLRVLRVEMVVNPPGAFETWLIQTIQDRRENRRRPAS
jgi:tetraacyldisaccharide 4'-kinase